MLQLRALQVQGFGPFAESQTLEFPNTPGVTVVYGENMRGKTSLLNAIRYAFFGKVLGRGSRERKLHTISNRELAAEGTFGFSVSLRFSYEDQDYELVRECIPEISCPTRDGDYREDVMLRRGTATLGPQERERTLQLVFPREVSRFFLFDGELLQEYEELLVNESETGHRLSEAIERILGVPILKRGRTHLRELADDADRQAAKEASRHQETQALGTALQQATEQKAAHLAELNRLQADLADLTIQRTDAEQELQSVQKYAGILEERDRKNQQLKDAASEEGEVRADLQKAMTEAWRALLRDRLKEARAAAQTRQEETLGEFVMSLRQIAVETERCNICEQEIRDPLRARLKATLSPGIARAKDDRSDLSAAMSRMRDLTQFRDSDNRGEVVQLWKRLRQLQLEQATLKDRISDLSAALRDSDPEFVRRSRTSYAEITEKVTIIRRGIEEQQKKIDERDQNVQRLSARLAASGSSDLKETQLRAKTLRDAAEVFNLAVERYKSDLRTRVEATASTLFLAMTSEKRDYASLSINDGYGLTIIHRDGRAEEARSAGAEHIVALALMGALQRNAPLRGPIVMDSPFGRLDETHTANVIRALPQMAKQVILLVYEAEVGRSQVREILGPSLLREYQLDYVSSRRTQIRAVV